MSGDVPVGGRGAEGEASEVDADEAAVRGGAAEEPGSTTGDGSVGEAGTDVDAGSAARADADAGDVGQVGSRSGSGSGAADGSADEPKLVIRRRGRRVTTDPAPGYTGEPPLERQQSSENDARLRGDVPPHWG